MSLSETVLLGAIAGATILIGLPIGRIRRPMPGTRAFLNALAIGILLFLIWDVLAHAWAPIDASLAGMHAGHGGLRTALGYGLLFVLGLTAGLLGLTLSNGGPARSPRAARARTTGRGSRSTSDPERGAPPSALPS